MRQGPNVEHLDADAPIHATGDTTAAVQTSYVDAYTS
jgi:hypothetical protein